MEGSDLRIVGLAPILSPEDSGADLASMPFIPTYCMCRVYTNLFVSTIYHVVRELGGF